MKKKNKPNKRDVEGGSSLTRLQFNCPDAQSVLVAGSFNDWKLTMPMVSSANGQWSKDLSLSPGRYEYRFVVNGDWVDDPAAESVVPNEHGGVNAVLIVKAEGESERGAAEGELVAT